MTTALGILAKCGIKECSSWGEVWSAVDTLIPFTAESITKQAELIEDMVLEGTAGKRAPNRGLIKVPGTLDFELDFYNCGKLLEMAMGSESRGVYGLVDDLAKIFVPFQRVAGIKTGGSGLGLAIAQKIIQKHGGSIRARNDDQGFAMDLALPRPANPGPGHAQASA